MINFKRIEPNDKEWLEPLLVAADLPGCHHNFTNLFAWSEVYNYHVAKVENFLVVKGGSLDNVPSYFYPAGKGDIKPIIEVLRQDAADCGHDFVLVGLTPENIAVVNDLYPGKFEYEAMRDSFDYVYLLDKLVNLKGNKLHSKRNHINRFKSNNDWNFELISSENIDECWEMNKKWCKEHDCKDNDQLKEEFCAVTRCFENFTELGLEGGVLRSEGMVIAFTMGDKLNSETYDIHIEKAFGEIQGAYQMINREFATYIKNKYPDIIYVNREEDMGLEGLRKAKLSYYPDKMVEKYWGKYIKE